MGLKPGGSRRLAILLAVLFLLGSLSLFERLRAGGASDQWYQRGLDASAATNLPAAREDFERAIADDPRNLKAYEMLSACFMGEAKPAEALEVLKKLEKQDPHRPHFESRVAEAYLYQPGENVFLLRWAREAVVMEPRSPRAHLLLAVALAGSGDGRDSSFQYAVAQQLSQSGLLRRQWATVQSSAKSPDKLLKVLKPLVSSVPY